MEIEKNASSMKIQQVVETMIGVQVQTFKLSIGTCIFQKNFF